MSDLYRKINLTRAEEIVAWTLDFISTDLDSLDNVEKWKLSADAHKFLRLWDISSQNGRQDGRLYIDPPSFKLIGLQQELKSAFDTYVKPFVEGKEVDQIAVPSSGKWPPRAFLAAKGELFCTRILEGKIERIGVANFLDALQSLTPLPLERFRKCEGCDRWFFPIGKRIRKERRFCSRACNLKDTARRQRARLKAAKKKSVQKGEEKNGASD